MHIRNSENLEPIRPQTARLTRRSMHIPPTDQNNKEIHTWNKRNALRQEKRTQKEYLRGGKREVDSLSWLLDYSERKESDGGALR